ncbi:MAG: tetratricopeptide repeat protein [Candidatus Omnitrophica bacterium]|nr:tetratricopeptide repeat protein [Candidatus Omnitrophota bacterium]
MLKRSEDKIGLTLNKRVSDLLLSAERAFRRKDYAQALDNYNQVLALDPGNRKAESGIDELNQYIKQQDYLLRLDSELNRAVTLRNQGEYRQAVSVLDGILEKDPGNRQARELKASCLDGIKKEDVLSGLWREANRLYTDKDYESALVKYSEILALNPGDSSALDMLNRCEDSIEIAKNRNIASLLTMGEKAKRNGDYNLAIDYFQKVLELDPGNKEAKNKISDIKFQSSPAVSAPEVAKLPEIPQPKPVDKNSELKRLWEEANNLYAGGDYAAALSRYNDIVLLQPSDQVAAQMARKCRDKIEQAQSRGSGSSTLFSQGLDKYNRADYAGAADIFEQILISDPANDRAYEYLDKSYSKLRVAEDYKVVPGPELKQSTSLDTYYRREDLIQEPLSTQAFSSSEIAAIYREALNLYKNKQYYDALEKFRMISQIESRYQSLSQKKIEECLNRIEKPQDPGSLEEKYQLALDYFKKDLYSQSIELLSEVLETKPNYKDAKRYLNLSQERLKIINGLNEFEQSELGKNK